MLIYTFFHVGVFLHCTAIQSFRKTNKTNMHTHVGYRNGWMTRNKGQVAVVTTKHPPIIHNQLYSFRQKVTRLPMHFQVRSQGKECRVFPHTHAQCLLRIGFCAAVSCQSKQGCFCLGSAFIACFAGAFSKSNITLFTYYVSYMGPLMVRNCSQWFMIVMNVNNDQYWLLMPMIAGASRAIFETQEQADPSKTSSVRRMSPCPLCFENLSLLSMLFPE